MNGSLATIRSAPGLEEYLERLEVRLEAAVASHPGLLAEVATESLAAGGKRLRPVLVYLTATPAERAGERCVAAGVAVELVHMATLVHDDMLDGADTRRGKPTIWVAYGRETAKAAGDYLFARAFAELARVRDMHGIAVLAEAALALARGEALQRRQAFRPDTPVDEYLQRASLKTGKLFEAACVLGGRDERVGSFGLALGVAFQIADDILDCAGDFDTTGKAPGVDLRDGTPTLPLILAAREDALVRDALEGLSPRDELGDALERVAATGALERSRETAREYARRARAALAGLDCAAELESLTYAVVDREN
jgi:geranylgeranyl pyrophosphate synthase